MEIKTSDGAVLHYRREGKGEPMVLIHGLASNLYSWNYQFHYFRNHFDTLAYDCRGHGRSTIPETLQMSDHARDAFEICSLFNQPVTVVGISMGGFIAQRLLIEHPEVVKRAVLMATKSHGKVSATQKAIDQLGKRSDPFTESTDRFQFARHFLFGPDTPDEKVASFVQSESVMPPEQFDLVRHAIGEFDNRPQLARCTHPVLVMHGDHDRLISPTLGEELAALLPNATLMMIEHGGHALMIEKHREVNEGIHRWITGQK